MKVRAPRQANSNSQLDQIAPIENSIGKSPGDSRRSKSGRGKSKDSSKNKEAEKLTLTERIKKAQVNPAAEGAKLDRKGLKYSGQKGDKKFFSKRKKNIGLLNQKLGMTASEGTDSESGAMGYNS